MASSMPVPVSPSVGPGLHGRPSGSPVMLIMPPVACAIMSKARLFSYGLPSPKPFTWRVDDARVELGEHVLAEAQPLDGARREVLDEHVGLARQVEHELLAGARLQVDGRATSCWR